MPLDVLDETLVKIGFTLSIIIFLLYPREKTEPGTGKVMFALFPTESFMLPPFNEIALELT